MPEYSNQALGLDDFMCNRTCEEVYGDEPQDFPMEPRERTMMDYVLRTVDAVAFACGLSVPDTQNSAQPY